MNKEALQYLRRKVWKFKLLLDLKELEDFKDSTVTRGQVESIERDLRMISYGFEEGIKFVKKEKTSSDKKN